MPIIGKNQAQSLLQGLVCDEADTKIVIQKKYNMQRKFTMELEVESLMPGKNSLRKWHLSGDLEEDLHFLNIEF